MKTIKITLVDKDIIDIAIKKLKQYKRQMITNLNKPSGRFGDEYISRLMIEDDKAIYELTIEKSCNKEK